MRQGKKKLLLALLFQLLIVMLYAQNPIIPGYFADPSIRYLDGKFYLSITGDGYEAHNGEPFVWTSDDLVNWDIHYLNINDRFFWAPSMVKGDNGKYYMVHQQGVDYRAYMMEADSPFGPWVQTFQIADFDVELFRDATGKILGVGSWKDIVEFDNDLQSPTYMRKIVRKISLKGELSDFTEGPYVFMRKDKYYLMWAGGHCWLDNYNVRYAVASAVDGKYQELDKDPILKSDAKRKIFGPGHSSVVEVAGRWILFYHRQDPDRHPTCNYRFTCAAELFFDRDGKITEVRPLDDLSSLGLVSKIRKNLAFEKKAFDTNGSPVHPAQYVIDGRNDTRWEAGLGEDKELTIDLGSKMPVSEVQIDFEYLDQYYLYRISYSDDAQHWTTYADYSTRAQKGYETRVSKNKVNTRYVRIHIIRGETKATPASIWEVKIF